MDALNLAKIALSNAFFTSFKAQVFHWNVTGNEFLQLHEFFGEIYKSATESVDVIAEQIRAMGIMAPVSITELMRYAYIDIENTAVDCTSMLFDLRATNDKSLETLNTLFDSLSLIKEQGFADCVATQINTIKKQNWMINSLLQK